MSKVPHSDIAKYMLDQMFSEKTNLYLAKKMFANRMAIGTRRIQSQYVIKMAKLDKNHAFAN